MTATPTARIAAFDFDGTLTTRDCVVPFLRRVRGTASLTGRLLARPDHLLPALARRDRDRLKALAARAAFRGASADTIESVANAYADRVVADWMRDDTVRRLDEHLAQGDAVVIVSASFEVYLRPLAERLGAVDILGTRLAVAGASFTGELDGPNCRGREKVNRLHVWLDRHHGGRQAVHVTAYGDSTGDRELLVDADEAHWLGSGRPPGWFPGSAQ